MQADAQRIQPAGARDGIRGRGSCDHETRRGQDAATVRHFDRIVDLGSGAEIIGGDDEPLQTASRRERRKWKNSTPSSRRRFMISGLVNISATMEAIFEGRK